MTNKILGIYFSEEDPMGYPFSSPEYLWAYQQIISKIEQADVDVYIVRGNSYLGKGAFQKGWRFIGEKLEEISEHIHVDLIYNKDSNNTIPYVTDCPIINHPELDKVCLDKIATAKEFSAFSPKTEEISSYEEYKQKIVEWGTSSEEKIVLKENFGHSGIGVHVLPVEQITLSLYDDWSNILMQEFIDSSIGIPGITDGTHDLRITVVNGEITNSFTRVPKKGEYIANLDRGAITKQVKLEEITEEIKKFTGEIIKQISEKYDTAIYSIDMMNSPKGLRLVELNSRPGLQHPDWMENYHVFNNAIVQAIIHTIK